MICYSYLGRENPFIQPVESAKTTLNNLPTSCSFWTDVGQIRFYPNKPSHSVVYGFSTSARLNYISGFLLIKRCLNYIKKD